MLRVWAKLLSIYGNSLLEVLPALTLTNNLGPSPGSAVTESFPFKTPTHFRNYLVHRIFNILFQNGLLQGEGSEGAKQKIQRERCETFGNYRTVKQVALEEGAGGSLGHTAKAQGLWPPPFSSSEQQLTQPCIFAILCQH